MSEQRLPYGKQISPSQVDLRGALEAARDAGTVPQDAYTAIGKAYFSKSKSDEEMRTKGMNCFLSMKYYGLIAGDQSSYVLTDLATNLLATKTDDELLEKFAEHILLNLNGLQLIEVLDSMHARGESITAAKVARELQAIGITSGGSSGEDINPLKLWLEKAGVLSRWDIDTTVLKKLTGTTTDELSELVALPDDQKAVLRALATITDPAPHLGSTLRELAEAQTPGLLIDLKQFAPITLKRLEVDGWVTVTKATGGRGAKPHQVAPTQKFNDTLSEPLMNAVLEQAHLQDPVSLRKPLSDLLDIVADGSQGNHARGLALEGVCIQIVRFIGARFVAWRLRGDKTSGAEVDVVAETLDNPYLLMQLQSKAGDIGGREVVDREVGVANSLKSSVILFVSAGKVGAAPRKAAAAHMQESGLAILFLDRTDLRGGAAGILAALQREWKRVREVRSHRTALRTQSLDE